MPRHIRNIIIATVLALLALAAGINGYIHHQFKTNIDSGLAALRPFAQINYSDLSTSIITGKVVLTNVRISGNFIPETLTLGNITFETPGFAYMLNGPSNVKNGEFPEHLGIAIDDFYLDLHGELADWLDKLAKRMQPIYASERKICAGKSIFGPSDYKEMGYTRLLSNMRMAYQYDSSSKTISVDVTSSARNMADVTAKIIIGNVASMSSSQALQAGMPQLASVNVTYKDKTYTPRVLKYCSALSNMKKEDYIEAEIKQSDKYFFMTWGFAPGTGLREAYKDFLLKPDTVIFTMEPGKELNPMTVMTLPSHELIEVLNMNLKINGLLVQDLSFKSVPARFKANFDRELTKNLDFESLVRGEAIKAPVKSNKPKAYVKQPPKFHKIDVKNAERHVSDYVHVTTKKGNKRKGQLMRTDNTNIYVQQKVSGGKFTMTIPKYKIKEMKAYFSK